MKIKIKNYFRYFRISFKAWITILYNIYAIPEY